VQATFFSTFFLNLRMNMLHLLLFFYYHHLSLSFSRYILKNSVHCRIKMNFRTIYTKCTGLTPMESEEGSAEILQIPCSKPFVGSVLKLSVHCDRESRLVDTMAKNHVFLS